MRQRLAALLFTIAVLAGPCFAADVFVANKPFKGQFVGVGKELKFSLVDLAKALDLRVDQTPEGWFLGGKPVSVTESQGVVWILVDALPPESVRVVRNADFGTLDVYRATSSTSSQEPAGSWGTLGRLIFFGTNWSVPTKDMQPTIAEIEAAHQVAVVYVDAEDTGSAAFRDYAYLFEGDKVPFFVLLDSKGRKVHSFAGFNTYPEMLAILKKYLK